MNVKSSHTQNNCPCPSTSKDMPHYNWYKWALLISKKHEQGRQVSSQSQESKTTVWSCGKCSFPTHLWKIYFQCLPGTLLDAHGYGSKHRAHNSSAGELLTAAFPEPACMTDTAPGGGTVTTTPTKQPSTNPARSTETQTVGRILFRTQSDHTETNNAQAKSILTVTYWHREQMVTLSENLFHKLGEKFTKR